MIYERRLPMTVIACVLAFLGSSATGQSFTARAQIHPGGACVKTSTDGAVTSFYGSVGNSSDTDTLRVDCPLWVSHETQGNGGFLFIIDRHSTANVTCSVVTSTIDGSDLNAVTYPAVGSTGSSADVQRVGLPTNVSHSVNAHAYLSCHIPPRSNGRTSYLMRYSFVTHTY